MKRVFLLSIAILLSLMTTAQPLEIKRVKYAGPFKMSAPFMSDTLDMNYKKWNPESLLNLPV